MSYGAFRGTDFIVEGDGYRVRRLGFDNGIFWYQAEWDCHPGVSVRNSDWQDAERSAKYHAAHPCEVTQNDECVFSGHTAQEWHDIALDWKRKAKHWEAEAKTATHDADLLAERLIEETECATADGVNVAADSWQRRTPIDSSGAP